jgi:enoyl-CoA hydratase/carnithine racemase
MGGVTTEIRGAIAIVTFDNAARRNAIDMGVAQGLAAATAALKRRHDIGALVLRGAGDKAFSAGVDLKFVEEFGDRAAGFAAIEEHVEAFCRDMNALPFPSIAMLHAHVHGGGVQLAATTDFRFADSALKLAIPAVKNHLYYPVSAIERLVMIVGEARAKRMFYEGEPLDAHRLRDWGFLDHVCGSSELERVTLDWAAKLAAQPRDVVAVYQEVFRALRAGDAVRTRKLREQAKRKR